MSPSNPNSPRKCGGSERAHLAEKARLEVRRCVSQLQTDDWTCIEIAEYLDVSRRTLNRWCSGDVLPDIVQYESLKLLAALQAGQRRRVG